jgi:hypothetical protein
MGPRSIISERWGAVVRCSAVAMLLFDFCLLVNDATEAGVYSSMSSLVENSREQVTPLPWLDLAPSDWPMPHLQRESSLVQVGVFAQAVDGDGDCAP